MTDSEALGVQLPTEEEAHAILRAEYPPEPGQPSIWQAWAQRVREIREARESATIRVQVRYNRGEAIEIKPEWDRAFWRPPRLFRARTRSEGHSG